MFLWSLYLLVKSDILNVIDVSNFFFSVFYNVLSQSCLTLCDLMGYSPPVSSAHGISQARILEWVATSYSRGSSWPKDQTCVSFIGRQILHHYAIWKLLLKICGESTTCFFFFFNFAFLVETFDDGHDSGDRLMIGDRCYWNNSGVKSLSWLPRQVRQRVLLCAPTVACASWCSTCCFIMICFWICLLCQLKLLGDTEVSYLFVYIIFSTFIIF